MTLKMSKRGLDLWTTALESGEYTQGKGYLRKSVDGEDEFCCLGVLCDIAIKDGLKLDTSTKSEDAETFTVHVYEGTTSALPSSVREHFGIGEYSAVRSSYARMWDEEYGLSCHRLITHNDAHDNDPQHRTFPQIAKILREQVVVIDD